MEAISLAWMNVKKAYLEEPWHAGFGNRKLARDPYSDRTRADWIMTHHSMAAIMIICERDEDEDEKKPPMFVDECPTLPAGELSEQQLRNEGLQKRYGPPLFALQRRLGLFRDGPNMDSSGPGPSHEDGIPL